VLFNLPAKYVSLGPDLPTLNTGRTEVPPVFVCIEPSWRSWPNETTIMPNEVLNGKKMDAHPVTLLGLSLGDGKATKRKITSPVPG